MTVMVNGKGIGVEHFPDRKQASLTVIEGNTHTVVASFKSESAAIYFKAALSELVDDIQEYTRGQANG